MRKVTSFIKPSNINMVTYRRDLLKGVKDLILPDLDIYEFGVFSGNSMRSILSGYQDCQVNYQTFWGLDSFCGIPKEDKEPLRKPEWGEGEFSSLDYLNMEDPVLASKAIKEIILKDHPGANIEMVVGFYKDIVFNPNMLPASYIDIDCDIYSSTVDVLDFMHRNKLITKGTIVSYDDWEGDYFGEGRAHIEFCNNHNVKFRKISDHHPMFICEEICH